MKTRTCAVWAAAALVLAGCGNDPDPSETVEPERTPSSAQTSTPAKDPDLIAAEQAVSRYQKVTRDLWANPQKSLNDIDAVAMDPASLQVKQRMQAARGNGMTGKGEMSYRDVTSQSVPGEDRATVEVDVCVDASKFVVKDAKGKRTGEGKRTSQAKYTVQQWGDKWYVSEESNERADC
ncbi:hypothetical protein DUHN55_32040 [Helicobacter pylori]